MKLHRDKNPDGKGKYVAINLQKIEGNPQTVEELIAAITANPESVEFGLPGTSEEFFLIKLKDRYAEDALLDYSIAASQDDREYANAVFALSERAGKNSPFCKRPD